MLPYIYDTNKTENYNSVLEEMMPDADLGFDQIEILKSTLCSKLFIYFEIHLILLHFLFSSFDCCQFFPTKCKDIN